MSSTGAWRAANSGRPTASSKGGDSHGVRQAAEHTMTVGSTVALNSVSRPGIFELAIMSGIGGTPSIGRG